MFAGDYWPTDSAGEVRLLAKKLSELLQLDASRGPEGSRPETLSGELGTAGGDMLEEFAKSQPKDI